jgi:hypothetical protein
MEKDIVEPLLDHPRAEEVKDIFVGGRLVVLVHFVQFDNPLIPTQANMLQSLTERLDLTIVENLRARNESIFPKEGNLLVREEASLALEFRQ